MKKTIKIILIIIALLLGVTFIVTNFFYKSFEEKYQYDADIVRLNHLQYYVTLIEEHKEKTGKYPLEVKKKPQNLLLDSLMSKKSKYQLFLFMLR